VSRAVPICPHCSRPDDEPLVCDRCAWRWYDNPKPAAAVLLERQTDDAAEPWVLLLKRAVEPGAGAWDLPAGYLDAGESFEAAARRETLEEAGVAVELVALAGVYHSPGANAVTVVYRARAIRAQEDVRIDFESSEHAWVARSSVSDWLGRMALPSMAAALDDWARGRVGGPSIGRA